jgi:hypothetical protein
MSHTTTLKIELTDKNAIQKAGELLAKAGWDVRIVEGNEVKLFDGTYKAKQGIIVKLPQWRYPILIDLEEGKIYYDNYDGRWGDTLYLDLFKTGYNAGKLLKAIEKRYGKTVAKQVEKQIIKQLQEKKHELNFAIKQGVRSREEVKEKMKLRIEIPV